jgi:hypothetical protein
MSIKKSSNPEINRVIEDAWLGIDLKDSEIFNPFSIIPEELQEEPETFVLWLLTQPEYFSFICKEILNVKILPSQAVILHEMWHRKFPMLIASRGFGKTWTLALYALLRILLLPNRKVVIAGAAFRQSKFVFDYMEAIYKNAPILRDIIGADGGPRRDVDMCRFHCGNSIAYAIPIGDGGKIRGLRANDVIADEFASINKDIFERVIVGFASVSNDPVGNVVTAAAIKKAKELGQWEDDDSDKYVGSMPNQVIVSGTAYYDFNHFADYWKQWHTIIKTRGDANMMRNLFGEDVNKTLSWKDFSIIRIPFELVPEGFMDVSQVARSKAVHKGMYDMEYGAVFTKDSMGFFKRSLIEGCVVNKDTNFMLMPKDSEIFEATLRGNHKKKYIMGVDPASEVDNFSIVILEIHETHRRIVYCWTTDAEDHRNKVKAGIVKETDFYSYCCRKIRDLMHVFPCERISIDAQGGGKAVIEALHDNDKMNAGEIALWPEILPDKPQDTDGFAGLHIINVVQFASADWTSEANHGLRKDLEDKVILFPFFDAITLGMSAISDGENNRKFDTLEDCVMDIEELKNELSTIVMTQTLSGRDRWDTPEIKLPGNKKGRMRKDRYSALLMANHVARTIQRSIPQQSYSSHMGFAKVLTRDDMSGPAFTGPSWYIEKMKDVY